MQCCRHTCAVLAVQEGRGVACSLALRGGGVCGLCRTPSATMSAFASDNTSFCSECGTILPLPGISERVTCTQCMATRPTKEYEGLETVTRTREFVFQKRTFDTQRQAARQTGATIEEKCPECGAEEMTFHTAQLRSADEGQTVFYSCKCGYKLTVSS
eukprot:m.116754 g.116754  ORF g.116754 m.116754 type:complete len:158 (+) comp9510_c0_seq3:523-996(+)